MSHFTTHLFTYRLFILWYMIVGDAKTPEMDRMFASLVPGFPIPPPAAMPPDLGCGGITCVEPSPVIQPSNTEKTPDDLTSYFLRSLMDFMVSQVSQDYSFYFVLRCLLIKFSCSFIITYGTYGGSFHQVMRKEGLISIEVELRFSFFFF